MSSAYENCSNLKYLKNCPICNNTTNLRYAFYNCSNLKNAPQFTGPVTDLASAFSNCRSLAVNVPVTNHDYIPSYSWSFVNCSNLTGTAIIGNNATSAYGAYENCSNISKMIVGKNLTNLRNVYSGCTRMTNLYVYNHNVNDISNAPYGCYLNIYVPNNSETFNTFKSKIITSGLNISGSNSILTLWNDYALVRLFGVDNVAETLSYRNNYKNDAIVIYSNNTMGIYKTLPSDLSNATAIHTDCFNLPIIHRTPWKADVTNVTDIIISNDVTLSNLNYWFTSTDINNVANIPINWSTVSSIYGTFAYCNNLTDAWQPPEHITDISELYKGCNNITVPKCANHIQKMDYTYAYCSNLKTSICGPNVINMVSTYSGCYNLSEAVCGPNVISMDHTY